MQFLFILFSKSTWHIVNILEIWVKNTWDVENLGKFIKKYVVIRNFVPSKLQLIVLAFALNFKWTFRVCKLSK